MANSELLMCAWGTMTARERDVWVAVYAAFWHQPQEASSLGHVNDDMRALHAIQQATRAVRALRAAIGIPIVAAVLK